MISGACALRLSAVAAASPERPGRVIAKPYEVSTGSKPSVIVGWGMIHAQVVLACMAGRAVQLYASLAVKPENLLRFWRAAKM